MVLFAIKEKIMLKKIKTYLFLHIVLIFYSITGVISKVASSVEFMSFEFILLYALVLVVLGFYAICWQQIIKRLPLTAAFANRAITVVWGIIWGIIFFQESITIGKVIGTILVIVGIVLYAYFSKQEKA